MVFSECRKWEIAPCKKRKKERKNRNVLASKAESRELLWVLSLLTCKSYYIFVIVRCMFYKNSIWSGFILALLMYFLCVTWPGYFSNCITGTFCFYISCIGKSFSVYLSKRTKRSFLSTATVEPRNNESAGESQNVRFCGNFSMRMERKWQKNQLQTENLSPEVGYTTSQALPCRNFTLQLSHYKKCFIATRAHLRTTALCQTHPKHPVGSASLYIFLLVPRHRVYPSMLAKPSFFCWRTLPDSGTPLFQCRPQN